MSYGEFVKYLSFAGLSPHSKKHFIAPAGDVTGVQDCARLDQAFDAIREVGHGTIVLGAGDHYWPQVAIVNGIQTRRSIPDNCAIIGEGIGKTNIKYVWDCNDQNEQANLLYANNVRNIFISDCTFDYQFPMDPRSFAYSTDNDSWWNCVRLIDCSNVWIEQCEFTGAGFHGIIGVGNCSNIFVENRNIFHDNGSRACHLHAEGSAGNSILRCKGNISYRNGRGAAFVYNCPGTINANTNTLTIAPADFAAMSCKWPQVGMNVTAIVKGVGAQGGDLIASVASTSGGNSLTFVAGQSATLNGVDVPVTFTNLANSGIFFAFGGQDVDISDNFIYDENGCGIQYATCATSERNLVASCKGNVNIASPGKMYFGKDIQASVSMSFYNGNPANGKTVLINGGIACTFVTSGATGYQVNIGADLAATLANFKAMLDVQVPATSYFCTVQPGTLTFIAGSGFANTAGNALTVGAGTYGATIATANFTGGALGDYARIKMAVAAAGQNYIRVNIGRGVHGIDNLVDILGSSMTLNDAEASIAFAGRTFAQGFDYNVQFLTIVPSGGNLARMSNRLRIKGNTVVNCVYGIGGAGANIELDNFVADSKLYGVLLGTGNAVTVKGQVVRSGVANVNFNVGSNTAIRDVTIDAVLDTCGGPNIHFNIAGPSGGARDIKISPNARIRNAGANPNFLTSQQLLGTAAGSGLHLQSDGVAQYKTIQVGGAAFTANRGGGIYVSYADKVQVIDTVFQDNGVNVASSQRSDLFCYLGCTDVTLFNTKHDNVDNGPNNQLVFSAAGGGVAGLRIAMTKSTYNRAGGGGATIQLGANSTGVAHYGNELPANAGITEPAYPAANKVTQPTSRTTAVTLNTMAGQVTGNNAPLAAGATATFIVNNAMVGLNDTVNVAFQDGTAPVNTQIERTVRAGAFKITLRNVDASLADTSTPVINFTVQKAWSALPA